MGVNNILLVSDYKPYNMLIADIINLWLLFLEHCDVNRENKFQQTPLIIAVVMDDFHIAKALVKAGTIHLMIYIGHYVPNTLK